MNTEYLSLISGSISSLIFVSSHVPMLHKVYKTKDLHSYSLLNLILVNVGNLIYWLYVLSLPLGPVWILHTFYTLSSGLLLIGYYRMYMGQLTRKTIKSWGHRVWSILWKHPRRPRQACLYPC